MSTKRSIILTEDNEHWYVETASYTNDEMDIELEIDFDNIKNFEYDKNSGLSLTLKGNCDLARRIIQMTKRIQDANR